MNQNYKIPNRIKNLCTKEFLILFKQELINKFKYLTEDSSYWSDYCYVTSTYGFQEALENACVKHPYSHMGKGIMNYVETLDWYDYDIFCDDLVMLMVKCGVIEKGFLDEDDES